MKYFKYYDPFFALIAANSKEEADSIFGKEVNCEDGTESPEEKEYKCHEISRLKAHHMFWKIVKNESFTVVAKNISGVLLVDSQLI